MPATSRKPLNYSTPPPQPTERQRELERYAHYVEPWRDRVLPIAMIVVGLLLNLRYFAVHYRINLRDIGLLAAVFAALAAAETVVMLGIAYAISEWLDVTFGRLGTAILKFAAIVTLCDGVFAGLPIALIPGHGFFALLVAFLIYEAASAYLFRLNFNDARAFVATLGCFWGLFHALLVANLVNITIWIGAGTARVSPFVSPKLWRLRPHAQLIVSPQSTIARLATADLECPDHAHSTGHPC